MAMHGDPLIDTLFDGRYLIIRKLGSGGMANVYLAADQELGRRVAIKILDDRHARDEQFVERFRREAQNAAGLSHPSIVSIYDRGDSEGTYYIAMEYVEGRTLKELLVARGPSPLGIAIDYTRQILSALRFAHRNGIVHRDIKPHNVIVDGEGRVKVMDFGIARAGAASQMTEAGSIIGTAQYLSPEQARGAPVDQTSDLYSTGIVLYELLTGSVPFTGETPVEIAMKHLSQAPVAAVRSPARDPARPRLRRPASAREGSRRPLPLGRGDGLRPRADRARDRRLRRDCRGGDDRSREDGRRRGGDDDRAGARSTSTTYTPGRYYEYDEPPRGARSGRGCSRSLLIAGAPRRRLVRLRGSCRTSSARAKPVAVPDVKGLTEQLAVANIREAGLKPSWCSASRTHDVKVGLVSEQDPQPGDRTEKGNFVTIVVSTGPPKTHGPGRRRPEQGPGRLGARQCGAEGQRRCRQLAPGRQHGARDRPEGRAPSWSKARPSASTSRRGRSRSRCRT